MSEDEKLASAKYAKMSNGIYYQKRDNCWIAFLNYGGRRKRACKFASFNINKYGPTTAKFAASLQRLLFIIRAGLWKCEDGDPFKILNYTETWEGNEITGELINPESPYIKHKSEN